MAEGIVSAVEYRDIPGFPGYRVGSDGSVWSKKRTGKPSKKDWPWKRLETTPTKSGYRQAGLRNDDGKHVIRFVHVLVLTAFAGPCPEGMQCAHDNGKRDDNRLDNLEWKTPKANWDDRRRHGTEMQGVDCHSAKLTDDGVRVIRTRLAAGEMHTVIAKDYGVTKGAISCIARGKTWKHVA
jgi:hypothetical protein